MAKRTIDVSTPNSGQGTELRSSMVMINENFNEVYGDNFVTEAMLTDDIVGAAELKVSDNGTDGQVLKSAGDGTFSWGDFLPLSGGTMTGAGSVNLPQDFKLQLGTGDVAEIYHDGTHFIVKNTEGQFNIEQAEVGSNITFKTSSSTALDTTALTISPEGNADFHGKVFSPQTAAGDTSSTLTTKSYIDNLITGATIYKGTWLPGAGYNNGYGSPGLNEVIQVSGFYYICSAYGSATPNGAGTEPNSWNVGDWVIWNDALDGGSGAWQKIDNSSVLSGAGQGQTVPLWQGADTVLDSETLGNSPISVNQGSGITTITGNLVAVLAETTTATTQLTGNNTTRIATTAFATAAAAAVPIADYLPLAGGTLTGDLTINHSSGDSLVLTKTTTEPSVRFEGDTDKDFVLTVSGETFTITQNDGGTDILSLDHDTKNATFAGNVNVNGTYFTVGNQGFIRSDDSGYLHLQGGTTGTRFYNTNNNTALFTILNNGNATFAGSITGTTATFTGSVTANTLTVGSGTSRLTATNAYPLQLNRGLDVDSVGANGAVLGIGTIKAGVYKDGVRISGNLALNGTDGNFAIQTLGDSDYTTALAIDSSQNATFSGNVNVSGSSKKLSLKAGAQLGFEDSTPLGTINLYNDGGQLSRLNIGGTMWVEEGASVGIGTNAAGAKLDVRSSLTTAETVAQFGNGNIQGGLQVETNGNLDWGLGTFNERNLTFSTNQLERMRITSAGNLVLNQATSRIFGGGTTTGRFLIGNSDSKGYMMINGSQHTDPNITYFVNNSAVTLLLNADNSATFRGSITSGEGNNFDPIIRVGRTEGTPAYSFTNDLDTGMFNPNTANTLAFSTGGTERLRIDNSGTVTIKNPTTSNLQLQSDQTNWVQNDVISNLNTFVSDTSAAGARDVAAIKVINEQAGTNTTMSGAMAFYTSAYNATVTEKMRITSGGVVEAKAGFSATLGNAFVNVRDNGDGAVLSTESSAKTIGMCSGTNYGTGTGFSWMKLTGGTGAKVIFMANNNGVQLATNASSWSSYSDETLKENIKPLENVLDKIKDYRCVEYNFKTDNDKKIGFIAQDWEDDFASIVDKNEDGILSIKYTETIPVLLKAIQELKAEIELLKAR